MTELRALQTGSAARGIARAAFECPASYGSLLLFARWLELIGAYRVRLGRRFDPPQDPETFRIELERYYRIELQKRTPAARSTAASCR
jgi:hypothetical protein